MTTEEQQEAMQAAIKILLGAFPGCDITVFIKGSGFKSVLGTKPVHKLIPSVMNIIEEHNLLFPKEGKLH